MPSKDIRSVFAGLRPLAAPAAEGKKTKEISRGHRILISDSGLFSLTGGKWTTYRKIGEDVLNRLEKNKGLSRTASVTGHLPIQGPDQELRNSINENAPGSKKILSTQLNISGTDVILAVRHEMARTLEDVLARRTRALQLDAEESIRMAPATAALMAREMGKDRKWVDLQIEKFTDLAKGYLIN